MNELETESISFADPIVDLHRWNVEAAIYQARAHGLRAGVRPNTEPPKPGNEDLPPIKRLVFIEYPEKTMKWGFTEVGDNIAWLDGLPQYDQ